MVTKDIPSLTSKLYELLEPIEPPMRKRAIKAALVMLGDDDLDFESDSSKWKSGQGLGVSADQGDLPRMVQTWMKSNSVSEDHLQHTFHIEGGKVHLIAGESPGKTGKERTINAYLLTGLTQFFEAGEAKFDDKRARAVCKSFGCLDESNHSYNLKGKKNLMSGTKDVGWTLTGPGLKAAAELVKAMADNR